MPTNRVAMAKAENSAYQVLRNNRLMGSATSRIQPAKPRAARGLASSFLKMSQMPTSQPMSTGALATLISITPSLLRNAAIVATWMALIARSDEG